MYLKRFLMFIVMLFAASHLAFGQVVSSNGGSIQGDITDPSGAKVPSATITISSPSTGYSKVLKTDSAGFYSLGPLTPGDYKVKVEAQGFQTLDVSTVIRTGTATSGTFKLPLGSSSETIEVAAGTLQVNTDQAGVSDVITTAQIDSLPVNGRNFLDIAQIEPGVILQSGQGFDPTKAGYSAISVGGVSGRTTRILLDGQDITDEFVGTTIFNVSEGSISEFQLNRANQDVSGDVTSTGQVLVSTRSGTNAYHGMAFYNFQDARAVFASATPGFAPSPFQRNQFGGSVGGPILKNKLFFFANVERIKQTQAAASAFGTNFTTSLGTLYPTYSTPYKETYSAGRIDWNGPLGGHYYFRANDNINGNTAGTQFSLYTNRDNTWGLAGGADYAFGKMTHSFRGSYEKFHNFITDATNGSTGLYNPLPGFSINYATQNVHTGPNANAPQATFQSDKQLRYDGSYTRGAHIIRFGSSVNRILPGAFAAFYGLGPRTNPTDSNLLDGVKTQTVANTANPSKLGCNGVAGAAACPTDILNGYNTSSLTIGNGQGFSSEISGFGLQGGGGSSWRTAAYVADSWKISPSMTMTFGLRYSIDTNRQNNDLAPPTCATLSTTTAYACGTQATTTSLFTLFGAPSNAVQTPYKNVAPQVGLVYAPGNHKTVLRAGFGIFYESDVFNNGSNARSNLLRSGAFYASKNPCTQNYAVTFPDGKVVTGVDTSGNVFTAAAPGGTNLQDLCQNRTISQSAPYFKALENAYQSSTRANSVVTNGSYIGNTLSASGLYYPKYKQPYSEQWNFGVQREIFKGGILSADYVHNSTIHIGQTLDVNHLGAARTFNQANAVAAVNATLAFCNATTVSAAVATNGCNPTPAAGATAVHRAATLSDFATRGLDSGATYAGGTNYAYAGKPNAGAFPGLNPNLGSGAFIQPIGRSGYDALQIVFRGQRSHPLPGVVSGNLQVSYNLSRIVSSASSSDEFFTNAVYDKDNPTAYIGRNGLDRKHQVNVGGSFRFKYGPELGLIAHFYSALPTSLTLDVPTTAGAIFQSDLTGDGTTGDLAPGTLQGDYMHRVKNNTLQSYISNFNGTYAGKLTPAGQAVVAGLAGTTQAISAAQLAQIGGAVQTVANMPQPIALNNPTYRTMDANLSYPISFSRFHEGLKLTPGVAFYNLGNFSNFSTYGGTLYNINTAGGPTYNGTSGITGQNNFVAASSGHRVLRGSGTFDQGGPRSAEFMLKLDF